MGTIEQYYDYCIQKYPGHKAGEYGKIIYHTKLTQEQESYVYSKACVDDIHGFLENNCRMDMTFLNQAAQMFSIKISVVANSLLHHV